MEENVVLHMEGIYKTFPGVKALQNVAFTLREGEIHALMGENGAGKSTLIKVLTGVYELDGGSIYLKGHGKIVNKSPQDAQDNGISTVYQEVCLCPNLSVSENIFMGREPRKGGFVDWKKMHEDSRKLLSSLDIDIDVTAAVENYSIAIQQMIAIARAVSTECKVLILDEPTSSLDDSEVEKLFSVMTNLKSKGVGIIFVTHFLEQVYQVCDRITVLRNGQLVGEYPIKDLPRVELVSKMLGKDLDDLAEIKNMRTTKPSEKVIIDADSVKSAKIKEFNINVHKGEVVGLAGLLGSGRSELVRAIYGADKANAGTVTCADKKVRSGNELESMKAGMAYLPEDRKKDGIIPDLSVRENMLIALQVKNGMFKLINKKNQEEFVDEYIKILQIKTASRETPIKSLSGGNQQKVILARWLLTNPEFIILDEPTRGIDIGTKTEIQKLILRFADEGKGVMFISSEIEEMLRTCSRMGIMRDGKKVGELSGEENLNVSSVMKAIAGGEK